MTDTETCKLMNAVYEMLKSCTIIEIQKIRDVAQTEMTGRHLQISVHCCNEAIRRKQKGIWK